jgi:hypothetical protein
MGYQIQKADLDKDGESIIEFWKQNFPTWPVQKFQWFYRENIYGPADCWLIKETGSGAVVGSMAVFPRRVHCDGKPLLAGITGDLGVDNRHRILGPALQLQKAVAESCRNGKYAFLYGYPNNRSEPVQKRGGFQIVGNSVRLARGMRTERYLARLIRVPLVPGIVGTVANWGFRIFARESLLRLNPDYRPELLQRTDERFNRLWKDASKNFRLVGERNHAFLTWRFVKCPFREYRIFTLCREKDSSLAGYVIYYLHENVVHISDILAETPRRLQEALLPAFLRFVRKGKYDSVSVLFFGGKEMPDSLGRFYFKRREDNRNIVALPGGGKELDQAVFDPVNWYFLEADNDG